MARFVRRRYGFTNLRKFNIRKLANDVSKVRSMLNVELKQYTALTGSTNVPALNTEWITYRLNSITQGSSGSSRDGSSAKFKSLQMVGRVKRSDTAQSTLKVERVRMVVFVDKEPYASGLGTSPSMLDMYTSYTPTSLRNWDSIQQKRFTVLWDRTFVLDQDDPEKVIRMYKRLNMISKWAQASTSGGQIANNALYLGICSDSSAIAAERASFLIDHRVTYVDN